MFIMFVRYYLPMFCLMVNNIVPISSSSSSKLSSNSKKDDHQWQSMAQQRLVKLHQSMYTNQNSRKVAKNVILFIGDGMGMTTITAARILKSELMAKQKLADNRQLSFDYFDSVALAQTFNLDSQVGDSGACATAIMSGVKANFETVGVNGQAKLNNCSSTLMPGVRVSSIADWAQQEGKSTGFVTTTRVTHATPAAFYAHSANRYWESDDKVPQTDGTTPLCKDIARQLVEDEPGKNLNVIMGGGRRHFIPNRNTSYAANEQARRKDGKNLIDMWLSDKQKRELSASYVSNRMELSELNTSNVDYLLGIFGSNHMAHEADRNNSDQYGEPSLAEMSVKAVEVLKHNSNGFLLMVESGRIDHAHHQNNAYRALTDTLALDEAIRKVLERVNLSNTLVIVTADHSHVFTFGGMAVKENTVLGLDRQLSDVDHLPYTTLLYGNGPGHRAERPNLHYIDTESKDYIQQAAVPKKWGTHGGEDVPVYATGVGSIVFQGVIDQTFIPHAISYAACMGPMKWLCLEHLNQSATEVGCHNHGHLIEQKTQSHMSHVENKRQRRKLFDFIRYNAIHQNNGTNHDTALVWQMLCLISVAVWWSL